MVDSEDPSNFWQQLSEWGLAVLQIIDLRLAILLAVAAFLLAVGVDSSGNLASAADLGNASLQVSAMASPQPVPTAASSLTVESAQAQAAPENTYLNPNPALAQRLHHGELTSHILTSSRLTSAHFFTDLPR